MRDKIKIILVDDHQLYLDGLSSALSNDDNFDIVLVENDAKEVLNTIENNIADIVITDISMPEMNGIEFIKFLKEKIPTMKVLVVSMFSNLKSYKDIDGYLLKDTDITELKSVVKKIVLENKKCFPYPKETIDNFSFKKTILSSREKEIVQLIAEEFTSDEIAEKLFVSKGTIETHRKNIFYKLQVKNIAGLIKKALYLGIVK